ncbi:MAG: hypothetical protein ABIB11_05065, partial [Candidatus Omnitrophota bacterium]
MPEGLLKRLVYYVLLVLIYPFEFLIRALKKKKDVLLIISYTSICEMALYLCNDLRHNQKLRIWVTFTSPKKLTKSEIRYLKKRYYYMPYALARFLKWDLILFTNHDRPFRSSSRKFYLRHGLSVNKLDENGDLLIFGKKAYDFRGRFIYKKVFVETRNQAQIILDHYPEFKDKLIIAGSLYMEQIRLKKRDKDKIFKYYGLDPSLKTILVFSSWGNCLIRFCGEELFNQLPLLLEDYNVIFSAHPKTVHKGDPGYEPISEKFDILQDEKSNFVFFTDNSWTEIVHHCDL